MCFKKPHLSTSFVKHGSNHIFVLQLCLDVQTEMCTIKQSHCKKLCKNNFFL